MRKRKSPFNVVWLIEIVPAVGGNFFKETSQAQLLMTFALQEQTVQISQEASLNDLESPFQICLLL